MRLRRAPVSTPARCQTPAAAAKPEPAGKLKSLAELNWQHTFVKELPCDPIQGDSNTRKVVGYFSSLVDTTPTSTDPQTVIASDEVRLRAATMTQNCTRHCTRSRHYFSTPEHGKETDYPVNPGPVKIAMTNLWRISVTLECVRLLLSSTWTPTNFILLSSPGSSAETSSSRAGAVHIHSARS